jgi:hypothetical protein
MFLFTIISLHSDGYSIESAITMPRMSTGPEVIAEATRRGWLPASRTPQQVVWYYTNEQDDDASEVIWSC